MKWQRNGNTALMPQGHNVPLKCRLETSEGKITKWYLEQTEGKTLMNIVNITATYMRNNVLFAAILDYSVHKCRLAVNGTCHVSDRH